MSWQISVSSSYTFLYFKDKIARIRESIPLIKGDPNRLTHRMMHNKGDINPFELSIPSICTIQKELRKLKPNSEGVDGINSTLLKVAAQNPKFLKCIHYIYSISILTNKFPEQWRSSKIRCLYKGNNKNPATLKSYRIIASVPVLSKC